MATEPVPSRSRLDQPLDRRRRWLPEYDPESFGRLSERAHGSWEQGGSSSG